MAYQTWLEVGRPGDQHVPPAVATNTEAPAVYPEALLKSMSSEGTYKRILPESVFIVIHLANRSHIQVARSQADTMSPTRDRHPGLRPQTSWEQAPSVGRTEHTAIDEILPAKMDVLDAE